MPVALRKELDLAATPIPRTAEIGSAESLRARLKRLMDCVPDDRYDNFYDRLCAALAGQEDKTGEWVAETLFRVVDEHAHLATTPLRQTLDILDHADRLFMAVCPLSILDDARSCWESTMDTIYENY